MGGTPIFLQFLYLSIQDLNFRERSQLYKAWDMTRHSRRDAQASGTPEVSHRDVPLLLMLLLDERRPLPFSRALLCSLDVSPHPPKLFWPPWQQTNTIQLYCPPKWWLWKLSSWRPRGEFSRPSITQQVQASKLREIYSWDGDRLSSICFFLPTK